MKQAFGIIAEILLQVFSKEVIEADLNISHDRWVSSLTDLSSFLRVHGIKDHTPAATKGDPNQKDVIKQVENKNKKRKFESYFNCPYPQPWFHRQDSMLAVKDSTSCLIASCRNDLKLMLIDKDCVLYLKRDWIPVGLTNRGTIQAVVYNPDQKTYFLSLGGVLFKKDLNDKNPSIYMRISSCLNYFPEKLMFRYSQRLKKLFCLVQQAPGYRDFQPQTRFAISMIDLKRRKKELKFPDYFQNSRKLQKISDFIILEKSEPRILISYYSGRIVLDRIGGRGGEGMRIWADPEATSEPSYPRSIHIDPKDQFFLLYTKISDRYSPSNFEDIYKIFKIQDRSIELRDKLSIDSSSGEEDLDSDDDDSNYRKNLIIKSRPCFYRYLKNSKISFIQLFQKQEKMYQARGRYFVEKKQNYFKEIIFDPESWVFSLTFCGLFEQNLRKGQTVDTRLTYFDQRVYCFNSKGFLNIFDSDFKVQRYPFNSLTI